MKSPPPVPPAETLPAAPPKSTSAPSKKPTKAALKGVIVKKKPKIAPEAKAPQERKEAHGDDTPPDPKRRKVALET